LGFVKNKGTDRKKIISRYFDLDFFGEKFNLANEELKLFEDVEINPTQVLIRLYIKSNKTKSGLIINNALDVYEESCGYIAAIGNRAFKIDRNEEWDNWYKVGDWLTIPRHSGVRFEYKKLPVFQMHWNSPMLKVKDPRFVS
jgi:co-chaperonin GroES (HSP10)